MRVKNQDVPVTKISAKPSEVLYVTFELSRKKWKLGFSDGTRSRARIVTVNAGGWNEIEEQISRARERFGLSKTAAVRSCYEAGREAFWLHRALVKRGIDNIVVDPASIQVQRGRKRAKTDRTDAEQLVRQLIRHWEGEEKVWSVVRVPDEQAEDARQLHRDMNILKRERTQHRLRIQSLLFTQGIDMAVGPDFEKRLEQLRQWDGRPLGEELRARILRECQRLRMTEADLRQLHRQQQERLRNEKSPALKKVRTLQRLCGIGMASSWMFVMELFGWRTFRNRRELAGAIGITPTPYQSGEMARDQGISRNGNRQVRAMAVEIAWAWLRFQPQSELSRWYEKRFAGGGGRMRKIGIVAMARKLMIDLWRYVEQGLVPAGAKLKSC